MSIIYEDNLHKYENLSDVDKLQDVTDVATLIDTFEDVRSKVGFDKIKTVLQDNDKYYYFVVSRNKEDFDLFEFINDKITTDISINIINAKIFFPQRLSRGIRDNTFSNNGDVYDQDTPTEFLDDTDNNMVLYSKSDGSYVDIPERGLVMGRSGSKVDYLVKGDGISRTHCKVYYGDNGNLLVSDFDSINGTFVNNKRVHSVEDIVLHDGDILSLANTEFKVLSR